MGLLAELRRRQRLSQFPGFARGICMTKVWDKYGAPDSCRSVPPGDCSCE